MLMHSFGHEREWEHIKNWIEMNVVEADKKRIENKE